MSPPMRYLNIVAGIGQAALRPDYARKLNLIILSSTGVNSFEQGAADSDIHSVWDGICDKSRHQGRDEEGDEKNKAFTRLDASAYAVVGEMTLPETGKRTAKIKTVTNAWFYEINKLGFSDKTGADKEKQRERTWLNGSGIKRHGRPFGGNFSSASGQG
jgi:hypothetical protein